MWNCTSILRNRIVCNDRNYNHSELRCDVVRGWNLAVIPCRDTIIKLYDVQIVGIWINLEDWTFLWNLLTVELISRDFGSTGTLEWNHLRVVSVVWWFLDWIGIWLSGTTDIWTNFSGSVGSPDSGLSLCCAAVQWLVSLSLSWMLLSKSEFVVCNCWHCLMVGF